MPQNKVLNTIRIGIIGDFNPNFRPHLATNKALEHAAERMSANIKIGWLPTQFLLDLESQKALKEFDGLWASPGSPYKSMEGALRAIRFAREQNRPFLGT